MTEGGARKRNVMDDKDIGEENLTSLFSFMWSQEKLPQVLKDASIVHLYKHKGEKYICDNYRGISLLPIVGNILARIMLNRLSCQEQNVGLYITFVDLTEEFDTVHLEGLWKIMAKFGFPAKFISMVQQFNNGKMTESTPNFSPLAKTEVHKDIARDFLFAGNCALNASTQADMQRSMDLFTRACDDFGLTISTNTTEVLHQPAPAAVYTEPQITTEGQRLTVAENFTYLGNTQSRSSNIDHSLRTLHMRCLRSLLCVKWEDRISDTEVLQRSKMESIHAILNRSYCSHCNRLFQGENGLISHLRTHPTPAGI
ncbi:uncharacterized protein LOC143027424 [Oratosquilla oratoria]|uniref:uncharacterized protein LOC143027424 n=1 Tax=Oratosquilla oratoria TaxID=337810 RepID=UPI003F75E0AE